MFLTPKHYEILDKAKRLLSAKRRLVSQDLIRFISIYLSHLTPSTSPPFHKEILILLSNLIKKGGEGGDPTGTLQNSNNTLPHFFPKNSKSVLTNYERLLFIAPRGFAKSTLCSVMFPIFLAAFGYRKDIFLVSATISLAKDLLRKIRNELENNDKLREDFGDLKSDKWTEDMLVLNNGVVLRAKGRGFQIRGFRPDLIVCDDLEDEEIIYSKEQREKMENWFFRTLLPALKPGQDLVYVGTQIHTLSLIAKLEHKEEFVSRRYKALVDEKSIWEDLWPTSRLLALRKEMGSYAFEAEYQNNPISSQDQLIKPYYLDGVKIDEKIEVSCLAIDPAISEKESSDERAFTLFGRTKNGFKEIYSESGRWSVSEQIERILSIYEKYHPERIVLEEIAFQKIFRDILLKEARKKNIFLPISSAELGVGADKRPKDKVTRLIQVLPLFEQKLVEIKNPNLYNQLLVFPNGDHDDLVDATVYALYWLMHYRHGLSFPKKEEVKIVDAKKGYYVDEIRPGVFVTKEGPPPMKIEKRIIKFR